MGSGINASIECVVTQVLFVRQGRRHGGRKGVWRTYCWAGRRRRVVCAYTGDALLNAFTVTEVIVWNRKT